MWKAIWHMMKCTVGLLQPQPGQDRSLSGARAAFIRAGWSWLKAVVISWRWFPLSCAHVTAAAQWEILLFWGVPLAGRRQWFDSSGVGEQQPLVLQGGGTCHLPCRAPRGANNRPGKEKCHPKDLSGDLGRAGYTHDFSDYLCFTSDLLAQQEIRRKITMPNKENK